MQKFKRAFLLRFFPRLLVKELVRELHERRTQERIIYLLEHGVEEKRCVDCIHWYRQALCTLRGIANFDECRNPKQTQHSFKYCSVLRNGHNMDYLCNIEGQWFEPRPPVHPTPKRWWQFWRS
jgi:hypothetical protein